jgi:hypothetical protein
MATLRREIMKQLIIYRALIGMMLGTLVLVGALGEAEDEIQGEVTSIDAGSGQLTLSSGKHLAIDAGTRVQKDGSRASLSDIREGDRVQVSFSPSVAWLLGRKDTLLDRVKQVVATSRAGGTDAM